MKQFEGKVVLVTGGTSGIGRATALAFAREGARVVVSGRREDLGAEVVREIETAGGQARFVRCDISDAAQVEALVNEAVETYGRLDCAFNNAGTTGPLRPLHECEENDFDATVGVNLKGVWLCMKHPGPYGHLRVFSPPVEKLASAFDWTNPRNPPKLSS